MLGSRYQLQRIAYLIYLLWVMESLHKYLLICDLYNDTAKRSNCLMSNMWLISDKLKGDEFPLTTNQKVPGSIPKGLIWNFHWHNPCSKTMLLGLKLQCMSRTVMGLLYFYIVWKQNDWGQRGLPQQGWTITRPTFVPRSTWVEVRLFTGWAGEEGYTF